ncbi:hypothetical protein XFUD_11250 [Xylella fastidiosa]|uniref:Uncharacterized protein n=1 Tax=Xylella fastidiosa (strain 9a5c) TaxID=160492 RepID=Q9PAE2_XYLFA|nr:hypothetical protein XF_2576 [Xylella fastidiosa 9a5c]ALQ95611.1 hypothetical protein XFUD_11250 [Xylella fastidiosa]ETE29516.1 hypothetical protein B398_11685 [Xylella fastidiosa 32]OCA57081.1 hypothetical protein AA93_11060 [Xylella fastidiosa subsp. pauca 11399]
MHASASYLGCGVLWKKLSHGEHMIDVGYLCAGWLAECAVRGRAIAVRCVDDVSVGVDVDPAQRWE